MNKSFKKIPLSLVLLIIFSLISRFLFLDRIPLGLSNDELDFSINAKAVFLRFSDITGQWNPLSLTTIPHEQAKSETLYLLLAPFIGPFPFSIVLAKLPFAVANIGLVILLYLITRKLLGAKEALFVGIVALCNPWFVFFGRLGYEAPVAMFFFFLSLYLLLVLRSWKILFVFIPLFLGFTTYMGTKLIFLPYSFIIMFFAWMTLYKKKYTKQLLILSGLCTILFIYYVIAVQHQATGIRLQELNSPQNPEIAQLVDNHRRAAINSPFTGIFSNKMTVFIDESLQRYFDAFSTQLLFGFGDKILLYSLVGHGFFYYIDAIFLLTGIYFIFTKNKQFLLLLGALLIIAPIPSVLNISGTSYSVRSAFLFPLLVMIAGIGFAAIWYWKINTVTRRNLRLLLVCLYGISVMQFFYVYLFRFPVYNSEASFFTERELAHYISLSKNKVVVAVTDPKLVFKQYLFYTNSYNRQTAYTLGEKFRAISYNNAQVSFVSCAEVKQILPDTTYVIFTDINNKVCKQLNEKMKNGIAIARLSDSGSVYNIYNDRVCNTYDLPHYISGVSLSDLRVDHAPAQDFCRKFIVRYTQ